ncbi:AMP-binding protein [Crenothrix polyspora]|uniref:Bifunctional protein Aas n=1 Tax=Crenothrix polyspora TaxID=360316 RepID=A0A1R4HHT4_9GAMM|nr:AMP-binding protein [Crenothrix polyspora]SJM95796.1 Bifunctional protein Aas (Includes: 2-acylglycerophosphoethanolamine acyltransferase; Acyl-(acyl-carrier-protein) synthetase) [Crenothrix polyspora]
MLKQSLRGLLKLIYRVEVKGMAHYHNAGERVLIVANHTSFLDPLLMWLFFPDDITFAINTQIFKRWWIQPFLRFSQVFPMDPTHPMSLKNLIHHLQTNTKTVIFPEGRITVTGGLMKIYDGTGMVADKSEAAILPVRINGGQYTHFSRLHKIVRLRLFPKITITILPHTRIDAPHDLRGKVRRKFSGHILADIMSDMMFATSNYQQTIFAGLLEARAIHGGKHTVAEDMERSPLSYDVLITRTIAIGNAIATITAPHENVGVFLPNSTKTLCVVLGLQLHGRVPAMMNYSIGSAGMISACQTAQVKTVLSSRRFTEAGKFEDEALALSQQVTLVYLEDLAENISGFDKALAFIHAKSAGFWYPKRAVSADHPAVVLFTSGSEGTPKGVVLSHTNILANHKQISARISFNPQDVVLNFLPMFHSFGFTVGTLLPVLNGMTTFFYPTPLHFTVIPEMAYETNATILFGTNTFLAAYGKKAHAYDFYKMRYVVAGAEKLQESTRALWADKFGIRILEGYGATETAPVTAVNTPMDCKAGTVGRLMPDMGYELEAIPGINDAGQLHVNGPNIMLGYLLHDNPGVLIPPESIYGKGWYDTGDIVHVDEDGFISIRGRSKRFAKVSGEMVSLTAVEQLAAHAWPLALHAAISVADSKKGEQVVLLTTQKLASISQLIAASPGTAAILLPKKIVLVDAIPVMATGKINYPAVTELASSHLK